MPISVVALHQNQMIPQGFAANGLNVFTGIVECTFKGAASGEITRDTLTFAVGRVNLPGITVAPRASCTVSLASFAYGGAVSDALWAVDSATVPAFVNIDRGTGTADLQVVANLAVRGANAVI